MHERAAVTAALGALMSEVPASPRRVVAALGAGTDPAVVRGIWEETIAGTHLSGAELVLASADDVLRCFVCGTVYHGAKLDPCPGCGGDGLVIQSAPEFEIVRWEAG